MNHLQFLALDIQGKNGQFNKLIKQIKVINIYDICDGQKYVLEKEMLHNRRAFYNIVYNKVILRQMFFLRDINAHSLIWNLHC